MPTTRSQSQIATQDKKPVLITGFGPFSVHTTNASWEAVKNLKEEGIDGVDLITYEIPVIYEDVLKSIPELWKKHDPELVVHVGVSGLATQLTVEKRAHNAGYKSIDVRGYLPRGGHCCVPSRHCDVIPKEAAAPRCLGTTFDVEAVCRAVNDAACAATATPSTDCGRYLCEFIYFTSLSMDPSRTIFIHVPPLCRPYTADELAAGLRVAILNLLDQLRLRS